MPSRLDVRPDGARAVRWEAVHGREDEEIEALRGEQGGVADRLAIEQGHGETLGQDGRVRVSQSPVEAGEIVDENRHIASLRPRVSCRRKLVLDRGRHLFQPPRLLRAENPYGLGVGDGRRGRLPVLAEPDGPVDRAALFEAWRLELEGLGALTDDLHDPRSDDLRRIALHLAVQSGGRLDSGVRHLDDDGLALHTAARGLQHLGVWRGEYASGNGQAQRECLRDRHGGSRPPS